MAWNEEEKAKYRESLIAQMGEMKRNGESLDREEFKYYREHHDITDATIDEWIRNWQQECRDAVNTLINRHPVYSGQPGDPPDTRNQQINERLRCMSDLAALLGGKTEETFRHCVMHLVSMEARLGLDGAPFSLGFAGRGMVGGLIFHQREREFSLHT